MKPVVVKLLFLILGFWVADAQSATVEPEDYYIQGEKIRFFLDRDKNLTLSSNCYKLKKYEPSCIATRALDRLGEAMETWEWRASLKEGQNPGLVICQELLRGEPKLGLTGTGSMRSFCQFKDGSIVGTGSIYSRYLKEKQDALRARIR